MSDQSQHEVTSPKSYGTAVALCGVFGTVGLHHFYLGNIIHGLLDLGLFVLFIWCMVIGNPLGFVVHPDRCDPYFYRFLPTYR